MSEGIPTKVVRGVTLRQDPARDASFKVVNTDAEMWEWPDATSEVARRERLHRHMNNEIGSIEIAAQMLVDFPDAPWELRMQLARQCWDESRHVAALYRRLRELGGHKGEFPVANFEWSVTGMLDSLPARLAVQNRTFEAGQMDLLGSLRQLWRGLGDETTAEVLETILADEVGHVRFANQWIRRLAEQDRGVLLKVAVAIRFLAVTNAALQPGEGERNAVGTDFANKKHGSSEINVEDRRLADFSEEEIREVLRQAGLQSVVPPEVAR